MLHQYIATIAHSEVDEVEDSLLEYISEDEEDDKFPINNNCQLPYRTPSQINNTHKSLILSTQTQTMSSQNQLTHSETSLFDKDRMEMDPLSNSVAQINLSGILNQTSTTKTKQNKPHKAWRRRPQLHRLKRKMPKGSFDNPS